jgi:hypothetical protein
VPAAVTASVAHPFSPITADTGGSVTETDPVSRSNSLSTAPKKNGASNEQPDAKLNPFTRMIVNKSGALPTETKDTDLLYTAPKIIVAGNAPAKKIMPVTRMMLNKSSALLDIKDKDLLYTAPTKNVALNAPDKLISMTRLMLNKSAAFPIKTKDTDTELYSLTPGQIADLCHVQHRTQNCGQNVAYTPLNPYRMSTMSSVYADEDERIDVQIEALKRKLNQITDS